MSQQAAPVSGPPAAGPHDAVLVYIGSGIDASPVAFPFPWTKAVREFVYLDPHVGLGELTRMAELLAYSCFGPTVRIDGAGYTRFSLTDGRVIHCFKNFDIDVVQGREPAELRALLARAEFALVKGYQPCEGFFAKLPRLITIYKSEQDLSDIPDARVENFVDYAREEEEDGKVGWIRYDCIDCADREGE
jgi:hypothetical protein